MGAPGARRVPALDGLRGVAVLLVVLSHAQLTPQVGGPVGVTVFFVLSGYLITGLLLDEIEETGTVGLRRFWCRRLLRLAPALLVMVALVELYVVAVGYPDLSLEKQRTRLLMGLSNLAARCGAEVTCCFDGAALEGRVPAVSARGVRVRFSKAGETADELIRRLVRAEPAGRPIVVISSDREVADGVRRHGAYPMGADSLIRRLARS